MTRDFANTLRISEIFYSIQGESSRIGLPTVFVRLTGCPLRCQYCDSEYAFHGGEIQSLEQIIKTVQTLFKSVDPSNQYITITGGEPLAQKACLSLMTKLCDLGYGVSIETSGALSISLIDKRVMVVMDLKTPDSKESSKNLMANLNYLKREDQIKFVICSQEDYNWSRDMLRKLNLADKCEVLFSPSYGQYGLRELADNVIQDRLPVRLQTQLHKHIWGDEPGR